MGITHSCLLASKYLSQSFQALLITIFSEETFLDSIIKSVNFESKGAVLLTTYFSQQLPLPSLPPLARSCWALFCSRGGSKTRVKPIPSGGNHKPSSVCDEDTRAG